MRPRVLIVEDDDDLREIVCEVLEGAGYDAKAACGGEEALVVLEDPERPHVILLDLTMPGMSGFELRERLLRVPELRSIPTIIMTASRAFDPATLSPAGVLLKPLDVSQLLEAIERVLPPFAVSPRDPS